MEVNKSLARNSIYNVAYKMLNMLFTLITETYVTRILLTAGVGKILYAQNIVAYFTTLAALRIPNYRIGEIAKVRKNKKMTNELFSEIFFINFISTAFCITVYYYMIMSVDAFK